MKRHLLMGVAPILAMMGGTALPSPLQFGIGPERLAPAGAAPGRSKSKHTAAQCQRAAKKRRAVKRARRLGHA